MPTISRSSNQKIDYFITILGNYYTTLIPSERSRSQEDKDALIYGGLSESKPLFEELNNRETTIMQKTQIIIDYLNQNCQGNCTQDNVNSFWYNINAWLDSNKEVIIQGGNGNRLFNKIVENLQCQRVKVWTPDVGNICLSLLERVSKLPDRGVSATQEEKTYTNKLLNRAINTVTNKLTELPERKLYVYCNSRGVFVKDYERLQHTYSYYSKAWFTKKPNTFSEDCYDKKTIEQLKSDQKYWLDHIGNKLTFGLELECSVPKSKFQEMVDKFIENGLADHNFINIGTDGTIQNISGYMGLEIKTVPLPYDEAMEKWALLGKTVQDFGGKFGNEIGCGGHIHMDKPKSVWEQIRIANHFSKLGPKLPEIFNRGEWNEKDQMYYGGYYNHIGNKIQTTKNKDKTLQIPHCIQFKQIYEYDSELTTKLQNEGKLSKKQGIGSLEWYITYSDRTAINFQNSSTIEFRGFNSRPNPEENLRVLAQEVSKILGNERVYGNGIGSIPLNEKQNKIFGIPESSKKEFIRTLQSLGYTDEHINFANKLAFNKSDSPEEMLKTAIDCINEFESQKQLEKQDEEEINYEYISSKELKEQESKDLEEVEEMEM